MSSPRIKVTSLIAAELSEEVRARAKLDTITDALILARRAWVSQQRIMKLTAKIAKKPLCFLSSVRSEKRKLRYIRF